jgi:hypothetical protein
MTPAPTPPLAILEPTLLNIYTYVAYKVAKDDIGTSDVLLI